MEKKELAQILNERFGLSIDWTLMRKADLEQIDRKFKSVIPREDITAENITAFTNDPIDFALEVLQKHGGLILADKIDDVIGFIREEGIGKGKILKELGLGEGGLSKIIKDQLKGKGKKGEGGKKET